VVGFQEKGSGRREEVVGAELVREEVRERGELRRFVGGNHDIHVGGGAEVLEELAAVAAGGGGDGEGGEVGLRIQREVADEELLRVDRVVEGEARKLEVDTDEDAAGGAQAHGGDLEVGDGWPSEGLGGGDQPGEEVR